MLALNLLGGAVLEGPEGPVSGRAAYRRRIAVLAILSLARGRPVGRERVIGLLWPDDRTERGRHLLSESLYVLRKDLGEDLFVTAGDEVGINPLVLRCDAAEFDQAVEEGRLKEAARLYRGPFLDGFYVNDAPDFERWAEGERDRLARSHARVLESLAQAAESAGRPGEAVDYWRRLAVHDPYDSRIAIRLMQALDDAGQRAAALWFADTHVALLREELGVEPDEDFAELVERLRAEPVRVPADPAPAPTPPAPAPEATGLATTSVQGPEEPSVPAADAADAPAPPLFAPPPEADSPPAGATGRATLHDPYTSSRTGVTPWVGARPPARPSRGWPRLARLAALAGMLLGIAAAQAGARQPSANAAARGGYDPRRIAVLYFDDHSRGGELQYLASGLTESLIHALSQVEALDVVSRNGVKPYRDHPLLFDSLVADLRVGSVVEGSVERAGENVRVTVQLVDGATQSHVESRTLTYPLEGGIEMEDALAEEVARFLRRRLGQEIRLRQARAETRSSEAWERVLRAEQAMDDAARLARTSERGDSRDAASADRLLARADSLLAQAEQADPRWARPTILRGWVQARRSIRTDGARGADLRRAAQGQARAVLAREPHNARALELRGTVSLHLALAATDSAAQARELERAERDLRAAVVAEPSLATAWKTLSSVLYVRGDLAESDLAARRALDQDAYLEDSESILHRLANTAMLRGGYAEARSLCDQGRRRAPADWRFLECALTLLRDDRSRPADPAAAYAVAGELAQRDPPERARAEGRMYAPAYRLALYAGVLARAGQHDSARAVLARAHRDVEHDSALRLSLLYDEAAARVLMGDSASARRLLGELFARRPALRAFAERDPLFRDLFPVSARSPGTSIAGSSTRAPSGASAGSPRSRR
jgi:DNA-binding SARP family transcriptional activator/TolB-like protein